MKHLHKILLLLAVTFYGCEEPEPFEWSKFKALFDGKPWEVNAVGIEREGIKDSVVIQATVFNSAGHLRQMLFLSILPIQIGNYQVLPYESTNDNRLKATYTTFSDDGDVVEDRFDILETEDNYFTVSSIDLHNMEMNGDFEMTFARDPNDHIDNQALPDTIRFTNGSFRIKIIKY